MCDVLFSYKEITAKPVLMPQLAYKEQDLDETNVYGMIFLFQKRWNTSWRSNKMQKTFNKLE